MSETDAVVTIRLIRLKDVTNFDVADIKADVLRAVKPYASIGTVEVVKRTVERSKEQL